MKKKINIAIDGYSSCGKSTLARDLAQVLNYTYIDTGAMYRAVTLYFIQNNIDFAEKNAVETALQNIQICFDTDEKQQAITLLNDENVELLIRSTIVAESVSEVSSIKEVRQFLVQQQQAIGAEKGVVMDGRDIGTVVFPDAELKFFITADLPTRVERRYLELLLKGIKASKEEIGQNIEHRDYIDTHRTESPLYKANDAILIDNSLLTREQQLRLCLNYALHIIEDSENITN
ncbi:MAG: (d)CMP kinase [Chitinophagales bacterium]|nr:(d)CMP kinase [Bacteroidota bacterium]MCB9044493.1 (d)CMP kinase [Chitinophagales bacterium]